MDRGLQPGQFYGISFGDSTTVDTNWLALFAGEKGADPQCAKVVRIVFACKVRGVSSLDGDGPAYCPPRRRYRDLKPVVQFAIKHIFSTVSKPVIVDYP